MNNRSTKAARKKLKPLAKEESRRHVSARIMPLWRRIVVIVFPVVRKNWILAWDSRHEKALKKTVKNLTRKIVRSR